jgi:hypothetical protein
MKEGNQGGKAVIICGPKDWVLRLRLRHIGQLWCWNEQFGRPHKRCEWVFFSDVFDCRRRREEEEDVMEGGEEGKSNQDDKIINAALNLKYAPIPENLTPRQKSRFRAGAHLCPS